jgi:hypothetical protein
LTFIGNPKYLQLWEHSQASATLVNQNLELAPGNRSLIQVVSADLAMVLIFAERGVALQVANTLKSRRRTTTWLL